MERDLENRGGEGLSGGMQCQNEACIEESVAKEEDVKVMQS